MPKLTRFAAITLLALLLTWSATSATLAQTPSDAEKQRMDQALQDYSYQFSKYDECHNKYITDRSAYISFQTATAKNSAFITTKDCLTKIYDVYVAYIRYIKEQGNVFNWNKKDEEKSQTFKTLDDEVTYFQDNQPNVGKLQTLEDTVPYAADLKTHITKTTYPIVLKALATYEVAESEAALEIFVNLSEKIRSLVTSKINQDQYISFLANWDTEIADIRSKSENYNGQARQALSTFKPSTNNTGNIGTVSSLTAKTKTELLRSKAIFVEILKLI